MKLPAFVIPQTVGRAVARLPQLPPTLVLVGALNLALDRILPRDRLEPVIGKRLLIAVTDAGLTLRFSMTSGGFVPTTDKTEPDLRISATTRDFLALVLREEDPDTLFFSRRLLMEGDTDLGLLVKNTLDTIELPSLASLSPKRVLERLLRTSPR
jgi:O2-independent ubiquinone biosynthesis accessory factor UbiT